MSRLMRSNYMGFTCRFHGIESSHVIFDQNWNSMKAAMSWQIRTGQGFGATVLTFEETLMLALCPEQPQSPGHPG